MNKPVCETEIRDRVIHDTLLRECVHDWNAVDFRVQIEAVAWCRACGSLRIGSMITKPYTTSVLRNLAFLTHRESALPG